MAKAGIKIMLVGTVGVLSMFFSNCKKDDVQNTATDVDQTAALKNVTVTYDSMEYIIGLPSGALDGRSFQEHRKEDSITYTNPENYSITLKPIMLCDNRKPNASDAKFDGITVNLQMDTMKSTPVKTVADAFLVPK